MAKEQDQATAADQQTQKTDTEHAQSATDQLLAGIGKAVAAGIIEASPAKKVSFGDYLRRRKAERPLTLTRPTWQNNHQLRDEQLSQDEIRLCNSLTHSGRYLNRLVEVVVTMDGAQEVCYIRWNNKSRDQMFELRGQFRSFKDCLEQIAEVQVGERDEAEIAEAAKQEQRRKFGRSKRTEDAYAKAQAGA